MSENQTEIETVDQPVEAARRQPEDKFGDLRQRLKNLQELWGGERVDPNADRIVSLEEQQKALFDRMNALVESLEKLKTETEGGIQNMDGSTKRMIERSEKAEELRESRFGEMVGIMEALIVTLESAPSGPGGGVPKSLIDDVEQLKGLKPRLDAVEEEFRKSPGPDEGDPVKEHMNELEAAIRVICHIGLRLDYEQDIVPKLKAELLEMEREVADEHI